ncbi:MAG: LytR C-terminal domain-containing protein, partial [Termitinemataceae bacterium]
YATYSLEPEEIDLESTIVRKQKVITALLAKLSESREYLEKPEVRRLIPSLMTTELPPASTIRIMSELAQMNIYKIQVQRVDGTTRTVSGIPMLFPAYDGVLIREIVNQSITSLLRQGEGEMPDRVFTVEVLNGSPMAGLARKTAELLKGFGYDVLSFGNADHNNYEKTQIIDRSRYPDVATELGKVLKCTNIVSETMETETKDIQDFEYKADFIIILGKDFNGRYVIN